MAFFNTFFGCMLILFLLYGPYCQMAPAVEAASSASTSNLFQSGSSQQFHLETTILLNELSSPYQGKYVGYQIKGNVIVKSKWKNPNNINEKLLQIELKSPKLYIQSRDGSIADSFTPHNSRLDNFQDEPFLILWDSGIIKDIYLNENEDLFTLNLKKGISSMFQIHLEGGERTEIDASGQCKVIYKAIDSHNFFKIKKNCLSEKSFPFRQHFEKIWRPVVHSKRECLYTLSKDKSKFDQIASEESHEMKTAIKQEAGSVINARQHLTSVDFSSSEETIKSNNLIEAITQLELNVGVKFQKLNLFTQIDTKNCQQENCPSLVKIVKENKALLKDDSLGTIRSAATFIKILNVARTASKEDIVKVLKNSKNKKIMDQLYDIIGATQTEVSHEAVMSVLSINSEESFAYWERYLWSLSFGAYPKLSTIKSILKLTEKTIENKKLKETLILTLAALASRYEKTEEDKQSQILITVFNKLKKELDNCPSIQKEEPDCELMYLRALKNLNHESTIPLLLKYALEGSKKSSVAAMKAIRALPSDKWDKNVQKVAHKIYFQLNRRYDSSARTLALDILLESKDLDDERLKHLLISLSYNDPVYEVKQYLLQRLYQISDKHQSIKESVDSLIKQLNFNHYGVLAQRGLSTALSRSFMTHPNTNGSLVSIQEISGGILKRGIVDVIVENSNETHSLFTLGLFAGGLSSYLSSSDDKKIDSSENEVEEEEAATAGMELTVLGIQIRPFVFFTGQGQLMGHVWSGTAAERTSAFQMLSLLHDHSQLIPLETGFIAELSLHGGLSFDLSGQVTMSLWNRNAQSLVEKRAGITILGAIRVNTNFIRSFVTYNVSTEVELSLSSDINFYNKVEMCLQLKQPDSVIRHNIHKVERIPGSKHRLRKSKYQTVVVPGKTYALNRKNNQMCSSIFGDFET